MVCYCRSWLAFVMLLLLGCQSEQQIESYTLDRKTSPRPPLNAPAVLEQLDHILVAIVPQDDRAWFFKLVGKAPAIERQREALDQFLATVQLADTSSDTPSWELPEGWKSQGEATAMRAAMRAATVIVPDSDGELELTVSSLPLGESWEDFLVPNVNRWLGQLQRAKLAKATVLSLQQQRPTVDAKATVFELSGVMSQRPMGGKRGGNPHEGLGIAPPNSTAKQASTAKRASVAEKALTYETPDDWQPGKLSMMRKAAFLLPGGGPTDGVTVTSFPAAPGTQMADVTVNIQRWARQVGVAQPEDKSFDKLTEPITVSGIEGTYVELTSPAEAASQQAIYVAMVEREGQVWFFKMHGKPELVSSQRDAFREFLGSVAFP